MQADKEGMCRPELGVCKAGERALILEQEELCNSLGRAAGTQGVDKFRRPLQGGAALRVGMQTLAGQGGVGKAVVPGKGGGHSRLPGPGPGGCAGREAQGTVPGTSAR